jgi:hypothetical protein
MAEDSPAARLLWRRKGPRGSAVVEEVSAAWGDDEAVDLRLKQDGRRIGAARGRAC